MKFIGCVLSILLLSEIATGNRIENNDKLFEKAWEYQNLLGELQAEIQHHIAEIGGSIFAVTQSSSNTTLEYIENNSKEILNIDVAIRTKLEENDVQHPCFMELMNGLNSITNTLGFAASNFIKSFNQKVAQILEGTNVALSDCYGVFGKVNQMASKSFIGFNKFMQPSEIVEKLKTSYEKHQQEWEEMKGKITESLSGLKESLDSENEALKLRFEASQNDSKPTFQKVDDSIEICLEFSRFYLYKSKYFNEHDFKLKNIVPY